MIYLYATFIAGYFLLPIASGHRRLYYILVLPAVLLLSRELVTFYRGNALAVLLLTYVAYMMSSLLWTADFSSAEAAMTLVYSLSVLTFCFVSGYLWTQQSQRMDHLAHRAVWLAAAAAIVSIVTWYLSNPFPSSRLVPLGVMHHENKAACAYGVFLVLCTHYLFTERGRDNKATYLALGLILLSLVLFTQSRTALAATCVAIMALIGYRALGLVLVGLAASWALVASNTLLWESRVMTVSFRPGIWEQVVTDMQGYWWFGRGYLIDARVAAYDMTFDHAHNSYLAGLRDGGLIGLSLLLALLAVAGLWAWRLYRQRGERIYLALLLYGMTAIIMDFDRLLVHPKEIWLFFWLPIALIMAVYPTRDDPAAVRYHGHTP
jgi:O-antigen ligase